MPEKTLNQIPPDLRRLHTRAVEAAQRENPDYAITLFCQILEKEPAFYEGRQAVARGAGQESRRSLVRLFQKMMSAARAPARRSPRPRWPWAAIRPKPWPSPSRC